MLTDTPGYKLLRALRAPGLHQDFTTPPRSVRPHVRSIRDHVHPRRLRTFQGC